LVTLTTAVKNFKILNRFVVSQGLDSRVQLVISDKLKSVKALLRTKVSFYDKDRYFSADIENAKTFIVNRSLLDIVDIELL
jgi:histidine ammonia-lyase